MAGKKRQLQSKKVPEAKILKKEEEEKTRT